MSCDTSKINTIENNLKNNPISVSTNDLIYYLQCMSNNKTLDSTNLNNTEEYLKQINNSFFYENIFVNTSNYKSIVYAFIGLLIPFYYSFPRFYKIGFAGMFIGTISFFMLFSKVNSLYSGFFKHIGILFMIITIIIYIVFFILLNKLNHISLFFISSIIAFLIINCLLRVILTIPIDKNIFNKYKATINNNTNFTPFNTTIETACYQVISRYKLKLPSADMLYSYLTIFQIGTNVGKYYDFITNLFGPFLSVFILWLLGSFLSSVKENDINLFPIIGISEDSIKYFTCQANYILPKELNVNLLIYELLEKYNFSDIIYNKVEKALVRISKELLKKYNPKFIKIENEDKNIILKNLKDNKIYIQLSKILKKNNFNFNINYIDEMKKIIHDDEIPYKNKLEMYKLLEHIDNTLLIVNEINKQYNNDDILARDELLYDKDIDDKYKEDLGKIINTYIENFKNNLNLKDGTLFGYHYNILTYSLFNHKVKDNSNEIFKNILKLISTWLLFAKPIGTPWLISNYIVSGKNDFKKLIQNLSSENIIWKYFGLGLDKSYFEKAYHTIKNNNENILSGVKHFLYTFFAFLILLPLFYFYNNATFGLTNSPSWYNLLYQIAFIINIIGNMHNKDNYLSFNIKFFIGLILIIIFASIIKHLINKYK